MKQYSGQLLACLTACLLLGFPFALFAQLRPSDPLQQQYQVHIRPAEEKIRLDGKLDESSWQQAEVATDFWMAFPVDDRKAPPEVQTEVRLLYDDHFLYIGAVCHTPHSRIIPTLKRDSRDIWRGDVFAVVIDPVNKSTNGFSFATNPAGVQNEALISGRTGTRAEMASGRGNSGINTAWDNKWYVEVENEADRWTVEMAIPFKSLRFDPQKRVWGINFSRGEPHSNSWHSWSPTPVQFLVIDLGYTGALVWDHSPKKVKSNVSLIPYLLGSYSQDLDEGEEGELGFRAGADAKIAISPTLNLDITLNPDFSQVEVDEQVTNLTTFNIRFPERRLFFLENSDLFSDFGIPPMRPFFSRRIGLDEEGNTIPILYGLRLSGNLNKDLRIGLMNMHTRQAGTFPQQNYTSLSLQQRVFQRSVIKGYLHNRQAISSGELGLNDYNRNAGLEFRYFSQDAKWQGFGGYGFSMSDGFKGQNYFYNIGGGYDGRDLSVYTNIAGIGDNYYADMGWIPFADHYDAVRDTSIHVGFNHLFSRASYTIYPENKAKINNHQFNARHILDVDKGLNLLQNRVEASYRINFANTSTWSMEYGHQTNQLLFPFSFTDGEPLPPGRYHSNFGRLSYSSDFRKLFGWRSSLQYGTFYDGTRLETSLSMLYRVQPWGNFGLNFVYNKLEFEAPYGSGNLFLISPRIEINFTRNLFWTTFLQYNTQRDNFNINSRLQWRFQPLSDLFVVYTDNYAVEMWGPKNRALVIKLNYWLNL